MQFTPNELKALSRAVDSKVKDTKRCLRRATAKQNTPLAQGLMKQITLWEVLLLRIQEAAGQGYIKSQVY